MNEEEERRLVLYSHVCLVVQREVTVEDIIKALPDRPTTLDIMIVTKILSSRGTKSLGDFEVQYIFEDKAREIVDE